MPRSRAVPPLPPALLWAQEPPLPLLLHLLLLLRLRPPRFLHRSPLLWPLLQQVQLQPEEILKVFLPQPLQASLVLAQAS